MFERVRYQLIRHHAQVSSYAGGIGDGLSFDGDRGASGGQRLAIEFRHLAQGGHQFHLLALGAVHLLLQHHEGVDARDRVLHQVRVEGTRGLMVELRLQQPGHDGEVVLGAMGDLVPESLGHAGPGVRSASRSRSWASFSAEMSVFVPNQRTTRPEEFFSGWIRVRKGRNFPSAPRSGKVMSNGSPVAMEVFQRSSTAGSASGSCTLCQPHPSICSGVVPVYSYQRRLYQVM